MQTKSHLSATIDYAEAGWLIIWPDHDSMAIRRFDPELSHAPRLVRNAFKRFDAATLDLCVVSVHVIDS